MLFVGHGNQDRFTSLTSDVIAVAYAPHELVFPFARPSFIKEESEPSRKRFWQANQC